MRAKKETTNNLKKKEALINPKQVPSCEMKGKEVKKRKWTVKKSKN